MRAWCREADCSSLTLSPTVFLRTLQTPKRLEPWESNVHPGAYNFTKSVKYEGAMPLTILYVRSEVLPHLNRKPVEPRAALE